MTPAVVLAGAFGTLGVGGGFALGAKLCRPEAEVWRGGDTGTWWPTGTAVPPAWPRVTCPFPCQVWVLYGDGSLGYSLIEFDTFVRHKVRRHRNGVWGGGIGGPVPALGCHRGAVAPCFVPCRRPSSPWSATTRAGAKSPGSRWPCWAATWHVASSTWVSAVPTVPYTLGGDTEPLDLGTLGGPGSPWGVLSRSWWPRIALTVPRSVATTQQGGWGRARWPRCHPRCHTGVTAPSLSPPCRLPRGGRSAGGQRLRGGAPGQRAAGRRPPRRAGCVPPRPPRPRQRPHRQDRLPRGLHLCLGTVPSLP